MFNPVTIHSEHDKCETGLYSLEMIVSFDNFQIYRPQIHENNGATIMFPQEARLRNFTYAFSMNFDINIKIIKSSGENLSILKIYLKNYLRFI